MTHISRLYRHALTGHPLLRNSLHFVVRRTLSQSTRHHASKLKLKQPNTASTSPPPVQQRAKLAKSVSETSTSQPAASTGTFEYPAALRIYSRSARRLALLGVIRLAPFVLTTIWEFQIGSMIYEGTLNDNMAIMQAVASIVPIVLVTYLTSGYVARVIVQLPPHARRSKEALHKWMKSIPPDTLLEIKTVRINGFGWTTDQCLVRDLVAKKAAWWDKGNLLRVVDPKVDKRRNGTLWQRVYDFIEGPPRSLKIEAEEGVKNKIVKEPLIWPMIEEQIKRRSKFAP